MSPNRWVHCRSCGQTFVAAPAGNCPLCGNVDGLTESAPPAPSSTAADRASWAIPTGPDHATSLAIGCLLTFLGIALGMWMAFSVPGGQVQPVEPGGAAPAYSAVVFVVQRLVLGVVLGACGGALASVMVLWLMGRVEGSRAIAREVVQKGDGGG